VRCPLPPGGRAKIINEWHLGQIGRSTWGMAFHPSQLKHPPNYFCSILFPPDNFEAGPQPPPGRGRFFWAGVPPPERIRSPMARLRQRVRNESSRADFYSSYFMGATLCLGIVRLVNP
jgi:hypothetical protein